MTRCNTLKRGQDAFKPLIHFTLGVFLSLSATAQEYYTWVDEDGITNYSERTPQGYQATKVTSSTNYSYTPSSSPKGGGSQNTAKDKKNTDQTEQNAKIDAMASEETQKIEQEIAKVKRANCQVGKRNLAQLQAYARIRVKDKEGQERILGDDEKQSKINDARKVIQDNCVG